MAHFRAVIKGQRGEASRLGSKNSGISTLLQTWGWNVRVDAHYDAKSLTDWATVELVNHTTGKKLQIAKLNLTAGYSVEREASNDFPITLIGDLKHAAKQKETVKRLTTPYQPKTGEPCSCRPGIERDNCPACEGTGQRIDFAAIRARNTQR